MCIRDRAGTAETERENDEESEGQGNLYDFSGSYVISESGLYCGEMCIRDRVCTLSQNTSNWRS